jgi:phenylpropionate dioxygenase-like ring-hydroxylating dioxygenase large terminal subunit
MRSLPLWCYTGEKFAEAEKERIFLPMWNLMEREEVAPNVGDFHSMDFFGVPVVVVRGKDEKIRVFANTCRHRGARLVDGDGNCKAFRCPYHFWSYGLDGHLIGAPNYKDPDGNPLIDDHNKEEFGLAEIESGTWGGFIFVRFRKGPQTLEQHLGRMVDQLASHRLEDMRVARKVVYDMDANWKCFVENYIDAYHIPYVHKDSLAQWKTREYVRPEPTGEESLAFAKHDGSQLLLPFPGFDGFPPMPQIDEDKKRGTFFCTLKPGMMMTMGNDGALVFQSEPISARKSRLTVSSLFPKSYFERDDFERLTQNYYRRNEMVVGEDKDIALRQFAGLLSPYARIARLGDQEMAVHDLSNWVLDKVIGAEGTASIAAE